MFQKSDVSANGQVVIDDAVSKKCSDLRTSLSSSTT